MLLPIADLSGTRTVARRTLPRGHIPDRQFADGQKPDGHLPSRTTARPYVSPTGQ